MYAKNKQTFLFSSDILWKIHLLTTSCLWWCWWLCYKFSCWNTYSNNYEYEMHINVLQTFTFEELNSTGAPTALLNNIWGAQFTELLSTTWKVYVLWRCVKIEILVELLSKLRRGINRAPGIFRNEGLVLLALLNQYVFLITLICFQGSAMQGQRTRSMYQQPQYIPCLIAT